MIGVVKMVYVVGERKNPDKPEPTVSKERLDAIRTELEPPIKQGDELWEADPTCKHKIVSARGGGVRCTKCGGWCCY